MLVEGSKEARRHLAVRDVLRASPAMAAKYAALKTDLAAQFGDDRKGYARAKATFMRELFDAAGVDQAARLQASRAEGITARRSR